MKCAGGRALQSAPWDHRLETRRWRQRLALPDVRQLNRRVLLAVALILGRRRNRYDAAVFDLRRTFHLRVAKKRLGQVVEVVPEDLVHIGTAAQQKHCSCHHPDCSPTAGWISHKAISKCLTTL